MAGVGCSSQHYLSLEEAGVLAEGEELEPSCRLLTSLPGSESNFTSLAE